MDDLVIGMAGSGGDGIVSAGESLVSSAVSDGYFAIMTKSFGSQIRGGESSCRVRLSTRRLHNPGGTLDVAVALNWDDFLRFGAELPVGGRTVVIYEARTGVDPARLPLEGVKPAEVIAVPIAELAKANGGDKSKNMVVLGLVAGWFGIGRASVLAGVQRKLGKKGEDVVAAATQAFTAGMAWAAAHPLREHRVMEPPVEQAGSLLLADGNAICATAALAAGCRFFGGYPITPSTEIMQQLAKEIWQYGGAVLQAEDEIAGIGAAVGASYAGTKSMTATSGPGMSLKTEVLGLATIAELPLVVVNVQRGGPSTGLPTKTEQADLFQACFSGHGDVLRPVLASTSVADTFATTVESFNIAEQYQTPVVLLSDQEIAQRKEAFPPFDTAAIPVIDRRLPSERELDDYRRFRFTDSGVSPISRPGMAGGSYLASGIEHNEAGDPTSSGQLHERMLDKRFRKLAPLHKRRDLFSIEGDPHAPLGLISWGSTAGVCREALALAQAEGIRVKLLVPRLLFPVAEEIYHEFLVTLRAGLVVEQSFQGQLYRLLRMYIDVPPEVEAMARAGANPFLPEEVVARLRSLSLALQRRHQRPYPE
jgi:2-oxoglutarate ferredoxin oxidoreductase subunit alpha